MPLHWGLSPNSHKTESGVTAPHSIKNKHKLKCNILRAWGATTTTTTWKEWEKVSWEKNDLPSGSKLILRTFLNTGQIAHNLLHSDSITFPEFHPHLWCFCTEVPFSSPLVNSHVPKSRVTFNASLKCFLLKEACLVLHGKDHSILRARGIYWKHVSVCNAISEWRFLWVWEPSLFTWSYLLHNHGAK